MSAPGPEGHAVVCGGGEVGRQAIIDLLQGGSDVVVIERDAEHVDRLRATFGERIRVLVGDATDDALLEAAGVDRAEALFSCLSGDKDNLIVTLSARLLAPGLRIAARCHESGVAAKIRAAGADAVLSPHELGGRRLANALMNPIAVSLIDVLLGADDAGTRLDEVGVTATGGGGYETVGGLRRAALEGLLVLAIRPRGADAWIVNPGDEVRLEAGSGLLFMAPPATRELLESTLVV